MLLGAHSQDGPLDGAHVRAVAAILVPDNFTRVDLGADLALLRLASPARLGPAVRPVCLPRASHRFAHGAACWATGWGDIQEEGKWGGGGSGEVRNRRGGASGAVPGRHLGASRRRRGARSVRPRGGSSGGGTRGAGPWAGARSADFRPAAAKAAPRVRQSSSPRARKLRLRTHPPHSLLTFPSRFFFPPFRIRLGFPP